MKISDIIFYIFSAVFFAKDLVVFLQDGYTVNGSLDQPLTIVLPSLRLSLLLGVGVLYLLNILERFSFLPNPEAGALFQARLFVGVLKFIIWGLIIIDIVAILLKL